MKAEYRLGTAWRQTSACPTKVHYKIHVNSGPRLTQQKPCRRGLKT